MRGCDQLFGAGRAVGLFGGALGKRDVKGRETTADEFYFTGSVLKTTRPRRTSLTYWHAVSSLLDSLGILECLRRPPTRGGMIIVVAKSVDEVSYGLVRGVT